MEWIDSLRLTFELLYTSSTPTPESSPRESVAPVRLAIKTGRTRKFGYAVNLFKVACHENFVSGLVRLLATDRP